MLTNYHTHSSFCDGHGAPDEYAAEAVRQGFHTLGFSSHAPVPFDNAWSLSYANLPTYCDTIKKLKEEYAGRLNVLLALEADYIPGASFPFARLKNSCGLDYIIGAVHLVSKKGLPGLWFIDGPVTNFDKGLEKVFKGDIQSGVEAYFRQVMEMLYTEKPDIIAHFDKIKMNNKGRYFTEEDTWYKALIKKTLRVIAETGCIVEVNTRGIYTKKYNGLYPSVNVLEQCHSLNIPVTINSDAHKPEDISQQFSETRQLLKDIGYTNVMIFTADGWKARSI
ncbi:MAG: histidinol-phosphatase [Bacteroidota bacterium]